jgi:alkylated DNA repair dioxygenase AlkB
MIINHYAPGQGILAHVDNVDCFTDYVVSIALGSSCIMEFTHIETGARVDVFFERRTAVLLSGAARYEWKHAIPASTHDEWKGSQYRRKNRVSLTWRKVVLTEKLQKMIDSRRTRAEQESDKPSDAIAM